jgi:mono/diheme cytochrome c family protein
LALAGTLLSQSRKSEISETTEDRIAASPWWPTKNIADGAQLVGNAECAKCHTDKAATQATTPMAHAAARAANAEILRDHEKLSGDLPPYHYEIARDQAGSTYSVSAPRNPAALFQTTRKNFRRSSIGRSASPTPDKPTLIRTTARTTKAASVFTKRCNRSRSQQAT